MFAYCFTLRILSYFHSDLPRTRELTHLSPGQNGRHFADDIFKCIFMNEKFGILIPISLKFVSKGPIDNKSSLVQVMGWRRTVQ